MGAYAYSHTTPIVSTAMSYGIGLATLLLAAPAEPTCSFTALRCDDALLTRELRDARLAGHDVFRFTRPRDYDSCDEGPRRIRRWISADAIF